MSMEGPRYLSSAALDALELSTTEVAESIEALLRSAYQRTKTIGETVYLGYGFEHAWEIVPGTWTYQIWHDGRKLAERSFTVEK